MLYSYFLCSEKVLVLCKKINFTFSITVKIHTGSKRKCFEFVQRKHFVSNKYVFNSLLPGLFFNYVDMARENIHSGEIDCIRNASLHI